ncbi:hypothetical protein Bpfe_004474 [Biomphalaria pfeifferi]|uniref:Uncharacterized protein n=1 Tax=Biomphalaria pfeifferi TaxID=112525 RepID=A0AAD8C651_BIOPF|nr:hypothetical protein Bpfe_004474 [Biomphalaria pfeifferi]
MKKVKTSAFLACRDNFTTYLVCLYVTLVKGQDDVADFRVGDLYMVSRNCSNSTLPLGTIHRFKACIVTSNYTHLSLSINNDNVYPSLAPCVSREWQLTSTITTFNVTLSNAASVDPDSKIVLTCFVHAPEEPIDIPFDLHLDWFLPVVVTAVIVSFPVVTCISLIIHDKITNAHGVHEERPSSPYSRRRNMIVHAKYCSCFLLMPWRCYRIADDVNGNASGTSLMMDDSVLRNIHEMELSIN